MAEDPLEELGITEDQVYEAAADEIEQELNRFAVGVRDYWWGVSPVETGEYRRAFTIEPLNDEKGRPARRISNEAKHAHIVEYGSEDTERFFPRGKTANHFGNEGRYMLP